MRTRTFALRTTSGETVTRYVIIIVIRRRNGVGVLIPWQTAFWNDKVNYHKKDE